MDGHAFTLKTHINIKVYFISRVAPAPVFQWPAQAPLLQRLQSRQGGLSDNTVERLRELGIYRQTEQQEEEVTENLEGGV